MKRNIGLTIAGIGGLLAGCGGERNVGSDVMEQINPTATPEQIDPYNGVNPIEFGYDEVKVYDPQVSKENNAIVRRVVKGNAEDYCEEHTLYDRKNSGAPIIANYFQELQDGEFIVKQVVECPVDFNNDNHISKADGEFLKTPKRTMSIGFKDTDNDGIYDEVEIGKFK